MTSALVVALDTIHALPAGPRILIGVAGAPGAGKSTLAAALADVLGDEALVLPMDGFHLPQARLIELGRRDRMGAPDTFDVDGFVATLAAVRGGGGVHVPLFDRNIEEPVPDALVIGHAIRIVVVEGNYLLHDEGGWERVRPLLDATFHLRVDERVRHDRLIARHIEYGKTPDAARAWALGPDERNAALIEAAAPRADRVLDVD